MKVSEKILLDRQGLQEHGPINVVIFGDSVSHGAVNGYQDYENVYWNLLKQRLNQFRDYVPVNMINAAIGGTTAKESVERMDKQVFCHMPDLVIVCFGLNDVNYPLEDYLDALRQIFGRCLTEKCDTIFMTPNMLNTYVADDTPKLHWNYAHRTADMQNSGKMDGFISAAIELATDMGIPVCDCYAKWKKLAETEDTTMLLANRINHPVSSMHQLFADSLYEMIMGDNASSASSDSTMIEGA